MKNKLSLSVACLVIFSCSTFADLVKKNPLEVCYDRSSSGYSRLSSYEAFDSLEECLASGGRLPKGDYGDNIYNLVKKSPLEVCHDRSSPSFSRLKNFEAFASLEACLASGGRLPSNRDPDNLVKKSLQAVCHDRSSPSYSRLKDFVAFSSLEACLASGGRLPKGDYGDNIYNLVKKSPLEVCHDRSSPSFSRLKNFEAFDSLEACLASGGRLPSNRDPDNLVKKSLQAVCHDRFSPSYSRLKDFVAFSSLEACLASGGRLPNRDYGDNIYNLVKKSPLEVCHDRSSPDYLGLANFEAFSSIDECLASGGRLPSNIGQGNFSLIKKSPLDFCYDKYSSIYSKLKNFESFGSLEECLASGGRMPGSDRN